MEEIKKKSFYIGLDKIPVYIEDVDNTIFNVIEVPDVFPIGKTSFLILGSKKLKKESDVLIEILDSENNVIFHEIIKYKEEKFGRIVSVYVYDHIKSGPIKITILGILENVSDEWKNKFNVKKIITSYVNIFKDNDSDLKFLNEPTVNIKYIEKKYFNFPQQTYLYLSHSISASNDAFIGYFDKYEKRGEYNLNTKYYIQLVSSSYSQLNNNEIIPPPNIKVKKEWLGADFIANNIKILNLYNNSINTIDYYSGKIIEIIDETKFIISPPLHIQLQDIYNNSSIIIVDTNNNLLNKNAFIHYKYITTGSITNLTSSFVEVNIKNLNPYSGKVNSIKVYKQNEFLNNINEFVGEFKIEQDNLFFNYENINEYYGIFKSDYDLLNWNLKHISGIEFGSGSIPDYAKPKIQFDPEKFLGSLKIIPCYAESKNENDPPLYDEEKRKFILYPKNFSLEVFKDNLYEITAKFYCKTSSIVVDYYVVNPPNPPIPIYLSQNTSSLLEVFISGSIFNNDELEYYNNNVLGKKLISLFSDVEKNFGELKFKFIPNKNGNITLNFVVFSGIWNIADIKIKQIILNGFNPNNFKFLIPLTDNKKRNERVQFKFEFLNSINKPANIIKKSEKILLKNQPLYIENDDNLLYGKLFISKILNSGFILSGIDSGSLFVSNNYLGKFSASNTGIGGLLIYSGSVFPSYSKTGIGAEFNTGTQNKGMIDFRYDPVSGSYLIISASIFALSGSNIGNALQSGSFIFNFESESNVWNITHNLNEKYLNVQIFNNLDEIIIPEKIFYKNNNEIQVYFTYPVSGKALVLKGGNFSSNINNTQFIGFISKSFINEKTWSFNHNLNQQFIFTETFDNFGNKIIPNGLKIINNNLLEIYFNNNESGIAIASTGNNIKNTEIFTIICSDETTQLVPINNVITLYMPKTFYIYDVKASLNTSATSGSVEFNIKINNNYLFIDNFKINSNVYFASKIPDIQLINEGDRISVNIISTGVNARGLKIYLLGYYY